MAEEMILLVGGDLHDKRVAIRYPMYEIRFPVVKPFPLKPMGPDAPNKPVEFRTWRYLRTDYFWGPHRLYVVDYLNPVMGWASYLISKTANIN